MKVYVAFCSHWCEKWYDYEVFSTREKAQEFLDDCDVPGSNYDNFDIVEKVLDED